MPPFPRENIIFGYFRQLVEAPLIYLYTLQIRHPRRERRQLRPLTVRNREQRGFLTQIPSL